jgi:hypothetical protein
MGMSVVVQVCPSSLGRDVLFGDASAAGSLVYTGGLVVTLSYE